MALPSQFSTQEAELRRKQMLAQLLMSQGMEQPQGQTVSGHYVAPNLLASLAPLAKMYTGQKLGERAEKGSAELQTNYQKALGEQLAAYREKTAADPMAAQEYMTSEFDPVKQIATKDYERLQKAMTPRTVNDKLVSLNPDGSVKELYNGAPKYSPVSTVATTAEGRDLMGQVEEGTGKVNVLGGQGKGIEINTGDTADTAMGKAVGPQIMKRLDKSYESTNQKRDSVRSLDSATEDLQSGINSGIAANVEQGLSKVYSLFSGAPVDPAVINTEAFANNMKRQVAAVAKSLGPAPTDADREFLKQMSGADVTLEPQSILRLLKLAKADAYNSMMDHQNLVDKAKSGFGEELGGRIDFYSVEMPEVGDTPDSGDIYFDKELKRYRVSPVKPKEAVTPENQYQGAKPIGTNSRGMPQYNLDDLVPPR